MKVKIMHIPTLPLININIFPFMINNRLRVIDFIQNQVLCISLTNLTLKSSMISINNRRFDITKGASKR